MVVTILFGQALITARFGAAIEHEVDKVHRVSDVGIIITIGVSGDQRIRRRSTFENEIDQEDGVGNINSAVDTGLASCVSITTRFPGPSIDGAGFVCTTTASTTTETGGQ